jgi:hypothetical protein
LILTIAHFFRNEGGDDGGSLNLAIQLNNVDDATDTWHDDLWEAEVIPYEED